MTARDTRPGPETIAKYKRRVAGLVQHMTLSDIRNIAGFEARRAWMKEHFDGWSQGLDAYLSASMARRASKLQAGNTP